ncbi:MAG: hypothetical protein JNL34_03720 [Anaerolineae bacterium]|nr:hypothetical protein [Anaerolineae bacterium]
MTFPALTMAFIVATLYGALFHLFAGGDARRLAIYLITAWLAFGVGQVLGSLLNVSLFSVGVLHLFAASAVCWVALVGVWLLMRRRRLLA